MICNQGEDADALFFLQRGEVEVLHLTQRVATIAAPAVFGEASLLRNQLDSAKKRLSGYRTTLTSMCVPAPPPAEAVRRATDVPRLPCALRFACAGAAMRAFRDGIGHVLSATRRPSFAGPAWPPMGSGRRTVSSLERLGLRMMLQCRPPACVTFAFTLKCARTANHTFDSTSVLQPSLPF